MIPTKEGGFRLEQTTVANAAENARLAPIPRAHYELPGWVTILGIGVCALAASFVADPLALGLALPAWVLTIAKVLVFVGGALGFAGRGVRLPAAGATVFPPSPQVTPPPSLVVDRATMRPSLRPLLPGPRDDAPIPFENDGGDGAK